MCSDNNPGGALAAAFRLAHWQFVGNWGLDFVFWGLYSASGMWSVFVLILLSLEVL